MRYQLLLCANLPSAFSISKSAALFNHYYSSTALPCRWQIRNDAERRLAITLSAPSKMQSINLKNRSINEWFAKHSFSQPSDWSSGNSISPIAYLRYCARRRQSWRMSYLAMVYVAAKNGAKHAQHADELSSCAYSNDRHGNPHVKHATFIGWQLSAAMWFSMLQNHILAIHS